MLAGVPIAKVKRVFARNFQYHGELGASVSVWRDGKEILSIADGWCEKEQQNPWTQNTMVPVYSCTKGPAAAILLQLLEEQGMTPETNVRELWEKFPHENATIAHMLSHQCGLAALDKKTSVWDYDEVIDAMEQQTPNWPLDDGHGYHPRSYGFLLEKIVRELTGGRPLGEVWREKIAQPMGIEFWIGLPESKFGRMARLYPGKMDKSDLDSGFYREINTEGTLVRKAFSSLRGLNSVREMNSPEAWQCGLPAMGGVGTASALAKFYQLAIGRIEFFSPSVLGWMRGIRVNGYDRVLLRNTAFSCGFQLDPLDNFGRKERHFYGLSKSAFGHPGAGGSHAFGDPSNGLSFAYTMNQMDLSPMPGIKSLEMVKALYL